MFQDSPFAPSRGSFQTPVLPPATDPDAAPTKNFAINCSWLPFIRGALLQLVLQASWKADEPLLTLTQERAMTLISMFQECPSALIPFLCSGDFGVSPSPFATISIYPPNNIGFWSAFVGYIETENAISGADCTRGADIEVQFSQPITPTQLTLRYSLAHSSYAFNTDIWRYMYDLDNGHFFQYDNSLTTPPTDATNVSWNWVGTNAPTSRLVFGVRCGSSPSCPTPGGSCALEALTIIGEAASNPC